MTPRAASYSTLTATAKETPLFRSIKPVSILFGATLAACSTTPGEKDLLPDTGPTTREVYDRHLSGGIAPFGDPVPPATPPAPSNVRERR